MLTKPNRTCPDCGEYVKNTGDNATISMEGTEQERRRHAEGYCPKEDKEL